MFAAAHVAVASGPSFSRLHECAGGLPQQRVLLRAHARLVAQWRLLYLGFGWIFVGYSIVKLTVIIGAHSAVRWDQFLYRYRVLRPLAWVVERTISTPATHFAHHALTQDDGIGHYIGNYGNMLFLWDVLFGTARITRQYPPAYGLKDDRRHGSEKWYTQLLFPIFRSKRAETVLGTEKHVPID